MRILLIISVLWCANVNAQSLLFEETFENIYGSTPTWFPVDQTAPKQYLNSVHAIENNGYPEALLKVYHAGTNTGRWHLDKLEPLFQGSTYRTEVTVVKATEDARCTPEMWYHFSVLFPTDSAASDTRKTSINQWFEDGSDELTLRTQNGRCFMELQSAAGEYRWDMFSGATTFNNTSVATFALHPFDQWDDLTFNINHQLGATGFIKVYRNGTLIHTFNGPTIHSIRPKWKIGIYSSQTQSSRPYKAIYFDNVRVGNNNSNLAEMRGSTPPANLAPIANAGTDQTITLPTSSVSLNGSSSTDPDGTITTYAWTKVSGGTATITSASSANTTVTGLAQGSYVFRLTVTDNGGATDFDDVAITVNPVPNVPPVAAAGSDQTIILPTSSVSISGSGSTDSDGTITTYAWLRISGPSTCIITSPSSASTTVTGLATVGTYTFRLTVTDNSGATATDNMVVSVLAAPNVLPISNAGSDQTVTLPVTTSTFAGSGSDADGTIVSYLWAKVSGPAGGTITTPSSATSGITALQQGTYSFRLTVTDNNGAMASDLMQIIVNPAIPPPNTPPTSEAGNNQTIQLPTSTATLDGTGSSDTDGIISSYVWVKLSGPVAGSITSPFAAITGLTGLVAGTYVFTLTVTDNGGSIGSDNVQVTVLPIANVPPTASAGGNVTIVLPASATTLSASPSTDSDGTIVSWLWTKISGPIGGTIANPTSISTAVTALQEGVYIFQLTVTDDDGATGTTAIQVTVQAAPTAMEPQVITTKKRYGISNMRDGVFY